MRCSTRAVSATVPITVPPATSAPATRAGTKRQRRAGSSGATFSPRRIHAPLWAWMPGSGRWMPSKMPPMSPGPSSTESGAPVRRTGAPGASRVVSS